MEKKEQNTRQEFLLTFFKGEGYEEKEVNGFWLVKQWNPVLQKHLVAIYTKESFEKMREFLKSRIPPDKLHIQSLFPKVG